MSANTELVEAFIAAWNRKDLDGVMDLLSDDCVYHNIPVAPVRGKAAIRRVVDGFAGENVSEVDWVLHHVAETPDGVVLTERLDRFHVDGTWVELPVMGSFEVGGGRITAWRDYFDLAQFQRQLPGA